MENIIIAFAAFGASLLTFFSGFGLGTILTPVFAFFFPLDVSVALTGVVHLVTNFVKAFLTRRHVKLTVVLWFGIPAILASFLGAWALIQLGNLQPVYEYYTGERHHTITPVKLVIAFLLLFFTVAELTPAFKNVSLKKNMLPLGGLLSGFFGGISGLQGAIRSVFLVKADLSAVTYIATGAVIACMVDVTRLSMYSSNFVQSGLSAYGKLVIIAILAAITGAVAGNMLIPKITLGFIRWLVAVLLVVIALALASGLM